MGERKEEEAISLNMKIPNAEVRYVYRNTILAWFDRKVRTADRTPLYQALLSGDCTTVEGILKKQLSESISFLIRRNNFTMVLWWECSAVSVNTSCSPTVKQGMEEQILLWCRQMSKNR